MPAAQKIVTFLWFDGNAEDAINLYTSVFEDAKTIDINRNGKAGPGPEGSVLTATFELAGQRFMALNGGPQYKFTEAISLMVNCETQEEIDRYCEKLIAGGGEQGPCGWLKDRFGLSWQIFPTVMAEMMKDKDRAKADRVMQAMLKMRKMDIALLKQAYDQK